MRSLLSMRREISPLAYALAAPPLLLVPHLAVAIAAFSNGLPLLPSTGFWLLPLRRMAYAGPIPGWAEALVMLAAIVAAWMLAILSFRRASRSSGPGYAIAALTLIPAVQIIAVFVLALLPNRSGEPAPEMESGINLIHVVQGVLTGMTLVVLAVLVSAVTFGAYGWGLFVMTPFLVGLTTAYIANRRNPLPSGHTMPLVMGATALGGAALLALALEGLMCIVLVAPLAAAVAGVGGAIGRAVALARHRCRTPLMSVALLPAIFALEAAIPPAVPIATEERIDIAAPPAAVWQALVSDSPIRSGPGLIGLAGFAYPIRGRLQGSGVGATRLGEFSTGTAVERVTEWEPGRRLAFTVLRQPPAMEEMSPYRRVHAPHVSGYFVTGDTRFELVPLSGGGTRLTVRASHLLRIDPVPYWEPMARWAIRANVTRVLRSIREQAEHPQLASGGATH